MSRRQVTDDDASWRAHCDQLARDEEARCLLCGKRTVVFVDPADEAGEALATFDLCGDCNRAFSELAQALDQAAERREARLELVDQVAGQLELVESACLCGHAQGSHVDPTPEVLYVCIECDCELFEVES